MKFYFIVGLYVLNEFQLSIWVCLFLINEGVLQSPHLLIKVWGDTWKVVNEKINLKFNKLLLFLALLFLWNNSLIK